MPGGSSLQRVMVRPMAGDWEGGAMGHGLIRVLRAVVAGTLRIAAACGGDDDGATPSRSVTAQPSVTRTHAAATPSPASELPSPPPCPLAEPQPFPTMFPSVPPLGGGDEITPPTYQEPRLVEQGAS